MRVFAARFLAEESGATAIEYALVGLLIAVTIVTALAALGGANGGLYADVMGRIRTALDNAV